MQLNKHYEQTFGGNVRLWTGDMEIETGRGTVGIIHADVPAGMSWPRFLAEIEAGNEKTIETCLWGRDRIRFDNEDGVPGVGRIFVGHTPRWGGLTRHGNVYALDTGAVFGEQGTRDEGCLTVARLTMKTEVLVAERNPVSLVDLRDDGIEPKVRFGAR